MKLVFTCLILLVAGRSLSQTKVDEKQARMQWFADAKLGIFIHTGIYSVKGVDESWAFFNKKMSHIEYMKQLGGFTMKKYDPAYWADLVQESGARYSVITTKHHDGVALYDTRMNKLSSVKATPSKRDIIAPFVAELRKRQIKVGLYYSLIDWSHPDYPGFLTDSVKYNMQHDFERWNRFRAFYQGQVREISKTFRPDLWWFDGDWEHSAEQWECGKMRQVILADNPDAIINGRFQGNGDYDTPEQNFPVTRPKERWWELCMTINNNWGYQPQDKNWKTPYEVITIFVDAVANGGNLLLDIGPREDGTIPEEEVDVLEKLGAWNRKNGEAVFNTIGGIPHGHFYGPTTLSKDSTTLYLFLPAKINGPIMLKGLVNAIEDVSVVGSTTKLSHKVVGKISWSHVPGLVYMDMPAAEQDPYVSVLRVRLKGPVKLYRGKGGFE